MKKLLYISIVVSLIGSSLWSCKKREDIITTDANATLTFSVDTVLFDTVFTDLATVTKRLTVTNPNKNAVNIDRIFVNSNSPYSLIINGEETNSLKDVFLRGEDQILILVKATLGANNDLGAFIVEDSIQFVTNGTEQHVKLLSWGQDAYFHSFSQLPCDEVWASDKPHVIFDQIYVAPGCKLTIQPGAQIYIHPSTFAYNVVVGDDVLGYDTVPVAGNGMLIGGTLEILGTDAAPVTITDDRLEEDYEHRPGLWGGIQFLNSSENSKIQWAEISNANTGISIVKPATATPGVTIENTIIRDMRYYGVYSIYAGINMTNSVITNCGQNSFSCVSGIYNIHHCTFAEYTFDFNRNDESHVLFVANEVELSDGQRIGGDLTFRMSNSIVWGEKGFSDSEEEVLLPVANSGFIYFLDFERNNIIKSENTDLVLVGESFKEEPKFLSKDSVKYHYDFNILESSPAVNAGTTQDVVSSDLNGGFSRTDGLPDIGAYEYNQ